MAAGLQIPTVSSVVQLRMAILVIYMQIYEILADFNLVVTKVGCQISGYMVAKRLVVVVVSSVLVVKSPSRLAVVHSEVFALVGVPARSAKGKCDLIKMGVTI